MELFYKHFFHLQNCSRNSLVSFTASTPLTASLFFHKRPYFGKSHHIPSASGKSTFKFSLPNCNHTYSLYVFFFHMVSSICHFLNLVFMVFLLIVPVRIYPCFLSPQSTCQTQFRLSGSLHGNNILEPTGLLLY